MFAPPGVDSDDSSGEEDLIPLRQDPPPRPSFLKTFLTPSRRPPVIQGKHSEELDPTPTDDEPPRRQPTPFRKRVRLLLEGEAHPDAEPIDLIASPVLAEGSSSQEDVEEPSPIGITPFMGGGRLDGTGPAGDDMLNMLQKILMESTGANRPSSPPPGATLTLLEDSDDETGLDETHRPNASTPPNALGLSTGHTPKPPLKPTLQGQGKKPGKLSLMSKLAQLHSPTRPSSPMNEAYSPSTPQGSVAPPYASPIVGNGAGPGRFHYTSPLRPSSADAQPASQSSSQYQTYPQYTSPRPDQYEDQDQDCRPFSNQAQQAYQGDPYQTYQQQQPYTPAPPQQPHNPYQAPWQTGEQQPHPPPTASASPNPYPPSQPAHMEMPQPFGLASAYYSAPDDPPAPQHSTNPYKPPPAPSSSTPMPPAPTTHEAPGGGWGFNMSNVPSSQFTNWPSHWRPGEAHWQRPQTPNSAPVNSQTNRGFLDNPNDPSYQAWSTTSPQAPPARHSQHPQYSQQPQHPPQHAQPSQPAQPFQPLQTYQPPQPAQSYQAPQFAQPAQPFPPPQLPLTPQLHHPYQPYQPPQTSLAPQAQYPTGGPPFYPPPSAPPWVQSHPTYHPPPAQPLYPYTPIPSYHPWPGYCPHHPPYPPPHAPCHCTSHPPQSSTHSSPASQTPLPAQTRQQEASTLVLPDEPPNAGADHAQDPAPTAPSPSKPTSAAEPPVKARSTPIKPIRTSPSPPVSPASPIFQAIQSPRIVKAHGDGFTVVEPYPEAQALSPKRRMPRSPPPRYATINAHVPPEKELETTPRKMSKEDLELRKAEYDQLVRERQKRKAEESADPKLSPAKPNAAVATITDTGGRDRVEKDRMEKDQKDRGDKESQSPQALANPQKESEATLALRKQLDMLRRHREKIKMKAANGQINQDEAEAALEKAEASIKALKRQIAGEVEAPQKVTDKSASKSKEGPPDDAGAGTPGGKSGGEQDVLPPSPAKSDKGKAKADPPPESTPKSPPDPNSKEGLLARLEDLKSRKDKIKAKLAKGSMDKDEGRAELMKLSMKQHETEKRLERLVKESDGTQPGPSSRPATSPVIGSESAGETPMKKGQISTPEEVESVKAKIKKRVAEGKMTPEEGKNELKRLLDSLPSPDETSSSKANKQEKKEEAKDTSSSEPTVDMVQRQIDKLKQKLAEKAIDPEKGQKELARLRKLREELSSKKESSSGKVERTTEGSSREKSIEGTPPPQTDNEVRRIDLQKRMERIKRKVAEGTMEKDEGKKEMARLIKALEAVSKDAKSDPVRDTPPEKPKESSRDLPKEEGKSERPREATTKEESGQAGQEGDVKKSTDITPEQEAQAKLAEITKQMERVKRKVAEGSMEKDIARKQLEEMAKARQGLKLKLQGLASRATSEQGGSGGKAASQGVEKSREELVRQMERIKRKVKDGSMGKEEGAKAMTKLQKAFAEMEEGAKREGDKSQMEQSADPLTSRIVPDASKRGRLEGKLEKNKQEMHSLQKKLAVGDQGKKERYEKMLQRLQDERKMLKASLAKLDQVGEGESRSDKSKAARVEDEVDEEEELDPEILALVLAEEKGELRKGDTSEQPIANLGTPDRVERGAEVEVPTPEAKGGTTLREGEEHSKGISPQPESSFYPDTSALSASTPVIPPTDVRPRPDSREAGTGSQSDQPAPPLHAPLPPPGPLNPNPTAPSDPQHEGRSSAAEPATPAESATGQAATASARTLSTGIPAKQRPISETPQNWSETIVSLAKCIDLANGMLEKLVAKHAQRGEEGHDRSILLEILSRVLTAVMLQRDIPGVLSRMIGEGSEESLEDLTRRVKSIHKYLARIELGEDVHARDGQSGAQEHVLLAIDRLLGYSKYLTPSMATSLRRLLRDWRKHGMTLSNILQTIKFIQEEVVESPRHPPLDGPTTRSSGLIDKAIDDSIATSRLLGLLETERASSPFAHPGSNSTRQTGETAVTPARDPPTTAQSSPSNHKLPHKSPGLSVQVHPHPSPHSNHPGSGSTDSSQPESPRRVRDRLNHMLQSLRRSSSPTSPPPLTAPLSSHLDLASSGTSREVHIPRTASIQRRVSGHATVSRRDSPPGLVLICESLSPSGKRKVQYLPLSTSSSGRGRRERDDDREHRHPPHSAPVLHLPPEAAEYLSSARRQHTMTPRLSSTRHRHDASSTLHHQPPREPSPRDGERVRPHPPRPSDSVRRERRETTRTTRPQSPSAEHTPPRPTSRRLSAQSSDSHYSDSSDTTEGTVESDEEARELLAKADSGPMPVHQTEPLVDEPAPQPSEDEVRRARQVLKPNIHL